MTPPSSRMRRFHSRLALAAAAAAALSLALAAVATRAPAQSLPLPRPALDWKTTESRHFVFHYPSAMREWTLSIAPRMDDIHRAVGAFVGFAPTRKVHVIVEDPLAESNGSAWPILPAPNIYL